MKNNCETILNENDIEIVVSYGFERTRDYYEEPENSATLVQGMTHTELYGVEVVISGKAVDILPLLNGTQKSWIIDQLQYED